MFACLSICVLHGKAQIPLEGLLLVKSYIWVFYLFVHRIQFNLQLDRNITDEYLLTFIKISV